MPNPACVDPNPTVQLEPHFSNFFTFLVWEAYGSTKTGIESPPSRIDSVIEGLFGMEKETPRLSSNYRSGTLRASNS